MEIYVSFYATSSVLCCIGLKIDLGLPNPKQYPPPEY